MTSRWAGGPWMRDPVTGPGGPAGDRCGRVGHAGYGRKWPNGLVGRMGGIGRAVHMGVRAGRLSFSWAAGGEVPRR